jgi:capsular exopolysaccharide synthesis family protein
MVRRRRWVILAGLTSVLCVVAVLTFLWPKAYKSSATFLVDKQIGNAESAALDVLQRLGAGSETGTETNLLRSRSVVEPVVDDLRLSIRVLADGKEQRPADLFPEFVVGRDAPAGEYRFVPSRSSYQVFEARSDSLVAVLSGDSVTHFAGLGLRLPDTLPYTRVVIQVETFPRAVAAVQRRIDASLVSPESNLIELRCESSTPLGAQQLCDGISRSYMRLRTELLRADATATATFLREQVGRLGTELTAVEDSIATYSRAHRTVALEERASGETQQYVQVQAQRDQLEAERGALANLTRGIESDPAGSRKYRDLAGFPALLKNDAVTGLLASLVELENRRVDLALRRTERNADLAAVDARIVDIERQLRAMAESYESGLALEIRALDGTLAQMRQRLATIPGEQVRYARLQRRASGIEDVYKMLTTRLKEAEVAEAVKLPNVRIVDAASLPYQASSPNVPLNLALGLIFGLMLGLTLALLREYWDSRLHERSEVEHVVGLPILAMIPSLRRPGPVVQVSMSGVGRSGAVLPPKREHRSARAELETQISLEAFRALAVDLKFAGEELGNRGLQTVAVTSSARGEGKTLTSCNLALTRASHGVRTLLIDADMRASGVSGFFGMNTPTYGLSDLLAGSAQMPAVCANLRVDGRHTLAVIPAGMPTPHSAELLDSPTMRQLLEEAKTQYELIVIDTPPLNAITDAATIAPIVDGVILVVRGGVTDRAGLEMTLERLARGNGRVVGVVLNDARLPEGYISRYRYPDSPKAKAHR